MATLVTTGDDRGREPAIDAFKTGATSAGRDEGASPDATAFGPAASEPAVGLTCAVVVCCDSCDCDASAPVSIPPSVQIRAADLFDGASYESPLLRSVVAPIARNASQGAWRGRDMRATSPPIRVMTGVRVI